jgi:hypothetical protein
MEKNKMIKLINTLAITIVSTFILISCSNEPDRSSLSVDDKEKGVQEVLGLHEILDICQNFMKGDPPLSQEEVNSLSKYVLEELFLKCSSTPFLQKIIHTKKLSDKELLYIVSQANFPLERIYALNYAGRISWKEVGELRNRYKPKRK